MRATKGKHHQIRKRFAIVICVAAVGAMALGAQTAAAATYKNTKLTVTTWEGGLFWGHVNAGDRKKCEAGRRVTLFKQRPGADRKLGTGISGRDPGRPGVRTGGSWGVRAPFEIGAVYATVSPKVGDGFVCGGDRSPLFRECASGYSPCLPNVPDLDCGQIPDSKKPVTVTGNDQYGLDADNDGVGCE
jgi:hypothetical protein